MGYYTDVVLDVYSVAKTDEEKEAVATTIALTLKDVIDKFIIKLESNSLNVNLDLSLESESILYYSECIKYYWIEENVNTLVTKLEELCELGIQVAYELITLGEDYSDITSASSSNAEHRWYISRNIERY
jgi:hypothetical protein